MLFVNSGRADVPDQIGLMTWHRGHRGIDPDIFGRYDAWGWANFVGQHISDIPAKLLYSSNMVIFGHVCRVGRKSALTMNHIHGMQRAVFRWLIRTLFGTYYVDPRFFLFLKKSLDPLSSLEGRAQRSSASDCRTEQMSQAVWTSGLSPS
jgi:hypothetical protein